MSQVSPRQACALEIQDTLFCLGLNEVYGVQMERAIDKKGKNHWALSFCRRGTVDGIVRVYSDRFIFINVQQYRGNVMFNNAYEAKKYLVKEFA